jgi:hypothetical protein
LTRFVLYSRSYCHLCDDMLVALQALQGAYSFSVDIIDIDIDAEPALLEQYDELVPVLCGSRHGEPMRQLCHYFLNDKIIRDFLSAPPS